VVCSAPAALRAAATAAAPPRLTSAAAAWRPPGAQLLARALFVEVMERRADRARALESRTLWGHVKNLLVGGGWRVGERRG
jgi:hypothetical protein